MSVDAFEQVIKYALPLFIGLWRLSNRVDVAAQVIALPELEGLRYDFQHDVERAVLILMRGARC
ncbi:hypothetical protein ACCQ10_02370 [Xanthomonas sp. NCPPB 1325]|uniref:hypothetical protein n=1 Tax=Xanthomonas sp. NCPPB 1325 TaxID=487529 RepID=UPI0035583377